MKIFISDDLGSAYTLDNGVLMFAPMMKDGTFNTDEFGAVEPELVGDESCTFNGVETTLDGAFKTITSLLS